MKTTAETMEQASTAIVPSQPRLRHPGLRAAAARAELRPHAALSRPTAPNWNGAMLEERMPAVLAWARANRHRPAGQR